MHMFIRGDGIFLYLGRSENLGQAANAKSDMIPPGRYCGKDPLSQPHYTQRPVPRKEDAAHLQDG